MAVMTSRVEQLIGAEVSYYTGKVRAYLRYKGIPFEELAATRKVYEEIIIPRTGVRFIPVLITHDDVAIQDSQAIMDHLEARYPERAIDPEGPVQQLVSLLLEVYADEWLVLPAMHYRWNIPENRSFAMAEFGRLSAPEASAAEQLAIGERIAKPFAGALPALGVDARTAAQVEASYLALLAELEQHLGAHRYLLGDRPVRADFALYGPLYAHLYRDPASGRKMKQAAPSVARWVERMRAADTEPGSLLAEDAIPEALDPVLARMFREFGPVLARTIEQLAAAQPQPDGSLPRAIGRHAFELAGARGERAVYPFNAYRWQRARDHYTRLTGHARAQADQLLERVGGAPLMRLAPARRIVRRANRLYFGE